MRDGQKLIAHELAHCLQQDTEHTIRRSPDSSSKRSTDIQLDKDGRTRASSLLAAVGSGAQILSVFFDIHQDEPSEQVLIEMSIAFVEGLSDDDVIELLTTPEGRTVAKATIGYARMGAYRVTGSILQVHARVEGVAAKKITTKDFANNDFECMNRLLFNVKSALGDRHVDVYASMVSRGRKLAANEAEAEATRTGKKKKVRPRNSHYMNALADLGHARYLGKAESVRDRCIAALVYGGSSAEKKDPFTFIDPDVALYEPDPEDMMLKAISGSSRGVYFFSASIQGHHTVTFIIAKYEDGPVAKGAGEAAYRLFFNEQYTDGPQRRGGENQLGEEITGADLIDRIFRLTATKHSDPANVNFGSQTHVDSQGKPNSTKARSILAKQRCSNNGAVRLWLILPGPGSIEKPAGPRLTGEPSLRHQGGDIVP